MCGVVLRRSGASALMESKSRCSIAVLKCGCDGKSYDGEGMSL